MSAFSKDSKSEIRVSTKRVFEHALYDSIQYACDACVVLAHLP